MNKVERDCLQLGKIDKFDKIEKNLSFTGEGSKCLQGTSL
jgi:hypothetical protein